MSTKTKRRVRHTCKQYVNTLTKEVKSVEVINGFIKPQFINNLKVKGQYL